MKNRTKSWWMGLSLLAMAMSVGIASAEEGWRVLLDGTSTEGWKMCGPGEFKVENGELVTHGGMGMLWYPGEQFADCQIRVKYKLSKPDDNSGVFIRFENEPANPMQAVNEGYEVQIDNQGDESHCTGTLYSLTQAKKRVVVEDGKVGTLLITLDGPRTMVHVEGELVTDFTEGDPVPKKVKPYEPNRGPRPNKGYIGLQNHGIQDKMHFLEVAVRPLDKSAGEAKDAVSLFDGTTLNGWIQKNGKATYRVEDGTIIGTTAPGSPNSFLCTEKDYGNFELTFDVKLMNNELNSGVQIRSQTEPTKSKKFFGRVNGPQVEIEASGENGAEAGYIYGESCGGWMTPEDELKPTKAFKDGEWNSYRIVAEGARIQTWINGEQIEDLTDEEKFVSHPKGFIGLQVHGVGDAGPYEVAWRNIVIREL